MTAQLTFDVDAPRARQTDPRTSRAAANRVWTGWPALIIDCLAVDGPGTDDQICTRLGVDPRKWPSVKTARSRVTHDSNPSKRLIVSAGYEKDGQTVWRHLHFPQHAEAVEIVGDLL